MDSGGGAEAVRSPIPQRRAADGWLNKFIDVEEARGLVVFAMPLILTNVAYYFIHLVLVMFTGHLGELELVDSSLANSSAAVPGFSLMIGLSGAFETLCGQGFGAKMYGMLGVYLQASCIISIIFTVAVWDPIFVISALYFGHKQWASLFSNNSHIISAFASMTPLLLASIPYDFIQEILSGLARGCGWQHLVVFVNFGTFHLIDMPIAGVFFIQV